MNEGENNFIEVTNSPFTEFSASTLIMADINDDDRLDVVIAGESSSGVFITTIYINEGRK